MRGSVSARALLVAITGLAAPAPAPASSPGRPDRPQTVQALPPGDHEIALRHGGRGRRYYVHIPPAARAGRPLPAMFAFHGGGGNAAGYRAYAGLDRVADREGFVAVYPDGTGRLRTRLLTWNAGGCCGQAREQNVDDVGFAIAVLDDLARRTMIDTDRVYATGHSNGAMMAYRLAAERAGRIAAIVPVAGAMILEGPFAPSAPVAVLHIHSVDDPRALYGGGVGPAFPLTNQRVSHRPVQDALRRWTRRNDCAAAPDTAETRRGRAGAPDSAHTAQLLVWRCTSGYDVAHWRLSGAGHGWPGGVRPELPERVMGPATAVVNAAEEAWRFASRFRRTARR